MPNETSPVVLKHGHVCWYTFPDKTLVTTFLNGHHVNRKPIEAIECPKTAEERIQMLQKFQAEGIVPDIIRVKNYKGAIGNGSNHHYMCLTPATQQLVFADSRFLGEGSQINYLFDTEVSRTVANNLNLQLSPFAISPESCKIMDDSIRTYLNMCIKDLEVWSLVTQEQYFNQWKDKGAIDCFASFSSLAFGLCSTYLMGIPLPKQQDFSYVLNDFFSASNGSYLGNLYTTAKKIYAKYFRYQPNYFATDLTTYLLEHIRETMKTYQIHQPPTSLIEYWLKNTLDKFIASFNEQKKEEHENLAATNGMTLEEMCLLHNAIAVYIGMQENFSFNVTEHLVQKARNDATPNPDTDKELAESMRMIPSSGVTRQLNHDTIITTANGSYHLCKGDLLSTHPIFHAYNPDLFPNPTDYEPERENKEQHCPFGKNAHQCPAKKFAMKWMSATIETLLENNHVALIVPPDLTHVIALTMKHVPAVKMILSQNSTGE